MCTPQGVFDICVSKAFDEVVKACKCVCQYRTNLRKLRTAIESLECRMAIIETKVGVAINDRGEEVENDVSYWQTKAGTLKSDVDQLVQNSTDNENMHCFTRSCPNIKCRYQMSKQAEQKIPELQQLIDEYSHFNQISHPRPPPAELEFPSNENYVNFDSRAPIFNKIVEALKDPDVKMIGLYGLGGVGKTTLVKEVGQKMRSDGNFKQVSLLVVSKELKQIQSNLVGSLNLQLDGKLEERGKASLLWNILMNGDYLVILDDIWNKVDLKTIGIPTKDENKRCKVLLTSRNKNLLEKEMKVDKNFHIGELQFPEAWTLFKKAARNLIEPQGEINSLAKQVCEKCKGLPVAISTLGVALAGEPKHAWETALVNLERYRLTKVEGIDRNVWATLRVSYNMLQSSNAETCFLLCCLFAEDAEISINDLTRHCVARRLLCPNPRTFDEATNAVSTIVGTLKSSSLLLNGSNENVFKIHDVIRDVGISIGREDKAFLVDHSALQWPENPVDGPSYEAISLRSGKIKKLSDGLICPQLHTLIFHNDELSDLEVPDKFFSGMKELKVLILTRLRMRRLPSSLANLTNLRMLYLNECELEDIAILGNLKNNLEVLSLQGSNITVLPQEIGQLTGLRSLDLRDCVKLQVIPQGVISHLTSLEELYFPDEFNKWKASTDKQHDTSSSSNVSLDELRESLSTGQLTTLHIHVPNAILLPKEGLKFEKVKRFNISVGSGFDYAEKHYSGTGRLKLVKISLRNELMPLVDKAELLALNEVEGLKEELHDRCVGCNWKYLHVESCFDDLECLIGKTKSLVPISHGLHTSSSLDKLTVLIIKKCNLKYLFSQSTARGLIHLEQLDISSCEIMEEIVRFEGQNDEDELISEVKFNKLKDLRLVALPNLISFSAKKEKMGTTMGSSSTGTQPIFSELVIFPVLETLSISSMGNITEIWDKQSIAVLQEQGSFCQLRNVYVCDCKRLCYVFPSNMHPMLKNLNSLDLDDCGSMEGVIVGFEGQQDEDGLENGVTFSKLSELELQNLPNLISFSTKLDKAETTERSSSTNYARPLFNKKVIFPVLKRLTIEAVGNITEIWDKQSIAVLQEQGSLCQLMDVTVMYNERLTYVFPSNMHPLLKNLKVLFIRDCESMEGIIVGFEGEQDEDGLENGVTFSELSKLNLWNLPNLISFSTKLDKAETTERSSSTNYARPLFNKKVIFPVLETLSISKVDNITEIWDKQSIAVLQEQRAFCQLRNVYVDNCKRLCYVFPSNMRPLLKNLNKLSISDCGSMKGIIVGFEGEQDEDGLENGVTFNKLSELRLRNLPNLISFSTKLDKAETIERSSSTNYARPLFNKKLAFPALETLYIENAPNITEIWDKQQLPKLKKETEPFYKLKDITVENCEQLVYVFPSYMLPRLQNLHTFKIKRCKKVEVIVSWELKEKKAANNDVIVFPQLKNVALEGLDKLRSFCPGTQVFFSNKLAFLALETLKIGNAPNITEIWDKQQLPEPEKGIESVCKLKDITVENCEQLVYVFPSYMLPQLQINLQTLKITNCKEMEVIALRELKEKEVANNGVMVFSQLVSVYLQGLDKLTSFCSGSQVFFADKVAFPTLEILFIGKAPNIIEIWDKKSLPELEKKIESFCKFKDITVENCEQLVYVLPNYMLPQLNTLQILKIRHCKKVEAIVSWELKEEEAANNDVIVFPQLKNVELEGLDKVRSFYPGMQVFFSNKLAFPTLETLKIGNVPNITEIWDKQQLPELEKETESFCKLKDLAVENCEQLVYVFPSYMLPRLQNLHTFKIKHCEMVEVIVSWELNEKEVANNDVIVFPQLKNVALEGLDKLRSFCLGTQVFFANKVAFPTLERLYLWSTPNITDIWDKEPLLEPEKETESFHKLKYFSMKACEQFVYVFPSFMLLQLQNLQNLEIEDCKEVEVIVSRELKEKEVANNASIMFPQLEEVKLKHLNKLKSFCSGTQLFFSDKIAFPALKKLYIGNAPNITEIWGKQQLPKPEKETESFCKLKYITVENCEQLVYLFPSYMLPQLQNLRCLGIRDCKKLEVILSWELKEKEAANNDVIVFSQLWSVNLKGLDKLTSFCFGSQVFFSNKVAFPALEWLDILNAPNIIEIWDKQQLPKPENKTKSFSELRYITVGGCDQLVYLFPSYMLPQLQINLQSLKVTDCKEMEVIVSREPKEKEAANNNVIVFSRLEDLTLMALNKCTTFCSGMQVVFSNKYAFPNLVEINLDENLESFRDETSTKKVVIEECGTSGKENDHNGEEG